MVWFCYWSDKEQQLNYHILLIISNTSIFNSFEYYENRALFKNKINAKNRRKFDDKYFNNN